MSRNQRKLICGTCGGYISSSGDELVIPDFLKKFPDLIEDAPVDALDPSTIVGASSTVRRATPEDSQIHR